MPEVEVVIAEVKKVKEGTSDRGPWTLWHVLDGNSVKYATFKVSQRDLAEKLIGKRARVTYKETDKGNTIEELAGPLAETNGDSPPLGTGEYVRGQTAPSDKRSITASVALKAAVDSLPSISIEPDASPKDVAMKVEPLAEAYFAWLLKKAVDPATLSDEAPF
jgi:hypothetical protein